MTYELHMDAHSDGAFEGGVRAVNHERKHDAEHKSAQMNRNHETHISQQHGNATRKEAGWNGVGLGFWWRLG